MSKNRGLDIIVYTTEFIETQTNRIAGRVRVAHCILIFRVWGLFKNEYYSDACFSKHN